MASGSGTKSAMLAVCLAVTSPMGLALAGPRLDAPPSMTNKPAKTKPAKVKAAAKTGKVRSLPAPFGAQPCARGQLRNDPVCLGADDPTSLPTPSRHGGGPGSGDIQLEAKGGVNTPSRAAQDPISFTGNNPNPRPSGSDFGAALGVKLPF